PSARRSSPTRTTPTGPDGSPCPPPTATSSTPPSATALTRAASPWAFPPAAGPWPPFARPRTDAPAFRQNDAVARSLLRAEQRRDGAGGGPGGGRPLGV